MAKKKYFNEKTGRVNHISDASFARLPESFKKDLRLVEDKPVKKPSVLKNKKTVSDD